MTSVADLERELHERERAPYRHLQERALVKIYTERVGHAPADRATSFDFSRQPSGFDYRVFLALLIAAGCIPGMGCTRQPAATEPALRAPDVRYEPTGRDVVKVMLQLADLKSGDVVYDLGCGDGRIVIAAVRQVNARGVCVDIDPQRIAESRDNARLAGTADRIRFLNEDLMTTDVSDATVIMLFLSPQLNLKVRPKLLRELKPGTRVVSHWHDMGDWRPERTVRVTSEGRERPVYLWTIPEHGSKQSP